MDPLHKYRSQCLIGHIYENCYDEHGNRTCNRQLIIPSRNHDTARFSHNIKDCKLHNGERNKTINALWRKFLGAETTYKVNGKNGLDIVVWNQQKRTMTSQ